MNQALALESLLLLLLSLELHAKLIMKELKMGSMFGTLMLY
jgi:hypothetical protein